jgi:TolB protein
MNMQKIIKSTLLAFLFLLPFTAHAILTMELTRGVAGAMPIAVVPFANAEGLPQDISGIVSNDLQNSGRFKVYGRSALKSFPSTPSEVSTSDFRRLGTDNVVIGKVIPLGGDRYQVNVQLLDMLHGNPAESVVMDKKYTVTGRELRAVAHRISDAIYLHLTGVRGIFSTRIVYVVVQRNAGSHPRYLLEVSDQDGYNPRPLLISPEPIMSPSWSPNGRDIAYVSFENRHASIYLQNTATGSRYQLSNYPGINGAPAWSPNGSKLALVLSKSGAPNVYIMDIASRQLRQLTRDFYINTEPSWSRDGKSIIFTSNRSGAPQIYQINVSGGETNRLTFDGDYNARGSFTPDGNHIALIHRVGGLYKIAILDLDNGTTRVLTSSAGDSTSPSVAPNGSMVLYDTISGGRNMLGMVSSDGAVQLLLPARNGEAQDPAWSPFST